MNEQTAKLADIQASFDDPSVANEELFDRLILYQVAEETTPLKKGPSPSAQAALDKWADTSGDPMPGWEAARTRYLKPKPHVVPAVEVLGDLDDPEAEAVLARPISYMVASQRATPGNKWIRVDGDVRALIEAELFDHPEREHKDGLAAVFAVGQKASKNTTHRGGQKVVTQYAYRIQDRIEAVTAIAIDVDGTDRIERVLARIRELGWFAVVYSTFSWTLKEGDRFRVVIFLTEPFEFPVGDKECRRQAVAEYQRFYAGVLNALGIKDVDGSAMTLNQMMYLPRRPKGAAYKHYVCAGRALTRDEIVPGDPSKFTKGASRGPMRTLSKKEMAGSTILANGFDVLEWYFDGGRYLLVTDVLEMLGWDTRGQSHDGWITCQCPNHAQHSDPDDDSAGFIEGEDGFGFHCLHDHCSGLNAITIWLLIEDAIAAGEIDLPDGFDNLSDLLCDASFYPDEIDGEEVHFDPADYGAAKKVEIQFLGTPKKVAKAFEAVISDHYAGEDDFVALWAGVIKSGSKGPAVDKLEDLMKTVERFSANDRTRIKAEGRKLLDKLRDEEVEVAKQQAAVDADEVRGNPSMDPSAPLGDTVTDALATLRRRYAPVDAEGKFRVVRKPDLEAFGSEYDSTVIYYTKTDFIDLHLDRRIKHKDSLIDAAELFLETEARKSGIVFAPWPASAGPTVLNTYQGRKLVSKPGDWPTIRRFILGVVCKGDRNKYRWLMMWMAHMVQRPGEKPGTAVICHGEGGTGKDTFGKILMKLTAPHAMVLSKEGHVVGQFAGEHLSKCILAIVTEAVFGKNPAVSSELKAMVDGLTIQAEAKGMRVVTVPSYLRLYFNSNDAVPVLIEGNGSERRYFVMKISDAKYGDTDYFDALHTAIDGDEMAALLAYLETYDPEDHGLSWGDVRTAPWTEERDLMGWHSLSAPMRRLKETLDEGSVTLPTPEGPEIFESGPNGLRIPQAPFRDFIGAVGNKNSAEDRDVPAMFQRLYPGLKLDEGQGKVGREDNKRWWNFPLEALGGAE